LLSWLVNNLILKIEWC